MSKNTAFRHGQARHLMDVEIKVFPEFIAVINRGKFSMADAQAGLIRVAEACRIHQCAKVLLDGRALDGGFSIGDRFDLAEYVVSVLPQGTRLATLSNAPVYQPSKVFEHTANNRGALVRTTNNPEEAAQFLGVDVKYLA